MLESQSEPGNERGDGGDDAGRNQPIVVRHVGQPHARADNHARHHDGASYALLLGWRFHFPLEGSVGGQHRPDFARRRHKEVAVGGKLAPHVVLHRGRRGPGTRSGLHLNVGVSDGGHDNLAGRNNRAALESSLGQDKTASSTHRNVSRGDSTMMPIHQQAHLTLLSNQSSALPCCCLNILTRVAFSLPCALTPLGNRGIFKRTSGGIVYG